MTPLRARRRLRDVDRGHDRHDRGMAMFVVLMCIVMSAALVTAVLAVVTSEMGPTAYQRKTARANAAAEAGLQAGLAALRAASRMTTEGFVGDVTQLPCTDRSPLTGDVGGATGGSRWSLQIRYFRDDPTSQDTAWREANAIACNVGFGPVAVPEYALLESAATAGAAAGKSATWGDRAQAVTYRFSRNDATIAGGLVRSSAYDGRDDLCWAATSVTAAAGSVVRLALCDPDDGRQSFSYRTDYSLVLSATQTSVRPPTGGLCLTGTTTVAAPNAVASLVLQPCDGRPAQTWAYDAGGRFVLERPDGSAMSSTCLSAPAVPGSALLPTSCSFAARWTPEPAVGAGAAGESTDQIVNYEQFGRCVDITNWDLYHRFLIDYPCKQNPLGPPDANQQWVYDPATRRIASRYGNGYCLTTASAAGGYVVVTPCSGAGNQTWTLTRDTGLRTTSWTIVDANGRCLDNGPPNTTEGPGTAQWSTIGVAACDGRMSQKWNAPPGVTAAGASSYRETTNGR